MCNDQLVAKAVTLTAEATSFSGRSIYKIVKKKKCTGSVETPAKVRPNARGK